MRPFMHNKTGNIYYAIEQVTNATNAQDGQDMVLYRRDGNLYVREVTEFHEKFTELTLKVGDLIAIGDGVYPITEIKGDEVFIDTPHGRKCNQSHHLLHHWRVVKPGASVLTRAGLEVTILEPQDLRNTTAIAVRTPTGRAKIAFNEIHSVLAYNPDSLFSNID